MAKLNRILFMVAVMLVTAVAAMASDEPRRSGSGVTLHNLQTAYNGESNAHARYLAFAQKADEEGYGQVASLFRAAARAEEIHAANHADVIKGLGGTPAAKIETPIVKSTKENLEAAVKGEQYESREMYPAFLREARREPAYEPGITHSERHKQRHAEANNEAARTFRLAKTAETEHLKLFTTALKDLDSLHGTGKMTYYVCSVCGFTTAKLDFVRCPSCDFPKHVYVSVS